MPSFEIHFTRHILKTSWDNFEVTKVKTAIQCRTDRAPDLISRKPKCQASYGLTAFTDSSLVTKMLVATVSFQAPLAENSAPHIQCMKYKYPLWWRNTWSNSRKMLFHFNVYNWLKRGHSSLHEQLLAIWQSLQGEKITLIFLQTKRCDSERQPGQWNLSLF